MRNEFLYSVSSPPRESSKDDVLHQRIYGRMGYFESRVKIGSRLRSLVRSCVDIERVLIPEKRCDNDAHVIAYFHARRIYVRARYTLCQPVCATKNRAK